jgi:hypothetical protein
MVDWKLSEKIEYLPKDMWGNMGFDYLKTEDVKEFIRLLKEKINAINRNEELEIGYIDELAGEKLK